MFFKIKKLIAEQYCKILESKISVMDNEYAGYSNDSDKAILEKITPLYKKYNFLPLTAAPLILEIKSGFKSDLLEHVAKLNSNYKNYSDKLMHYLLHVNASWGTNTVKILDKNGLFRGLSLEEMDLQETVLQKTLKSVLDDHNDAAFDFIISIMKEARKWKVLDVEKTSLLADLDEKPVQKSMVL